MKVSVVIPLYNKAEFIVEAIESVLHQNFPDLEIIVVNDGSTDGSMEQVASINDDRIKPFHNPRNMGAALTAQRAIDEAQGEYIMRLDADDICMPDRIHKQVAYMETHPDVGASGGYLQLFGNSNEQWKFPEHNDDCVAQLLFGIPVAQPASIMRHSVIKEHDLRYAADLPPIGEDWLYYLPWHKVTRFGNLTEPVISYRRGDHNAAVGRDRYLDHKLLFERVFQFFDIHLSEADLKLQFLTMKYFVDPPGRSTITAYRAWLDRLISINGKRGLFPASNFNARVEKAWNELFYYLPERSAAAALEHMRLSGSWPMDKLSYLAKTKASAMLGRS